MADKDAGRIVVANTLLAKGFVQIPIVVLQDHSLSAGAKLTYGALLWYHWRGGGYPGQETMGDEFGFSPTSAWRYLKELQSKGYIEVARPGLGAPNEYYLPDIFLSPQYEGSCSFNLKEQSLQSEGTLEVQDSTNDIKNEYERPSTATQEEGAPLAHHDPTDSLSLSSIAYTASQRLNNGQQLRSILGFLEGRNSEPGFTLEIARQAFDHTVARHEDEPLKTPIAFFYKTCQLLRAKTMAEAETAKEERQRQFTVALSVAQFYLGDNGDIDAAYRAVEEYWPDLADPVIAELKNRKPAPG